MKIIIKKAAYIAYFIIPIILSWSFRIEEGDMFNVSQPDYNGLNSRIIEKINERRLKKKESLLELNNSLQLTALYLTRDLRLSKFEKLMDERRILKRKTYVQSWKYGFQNTILDVTITLNKAINFKGGSFYYDKTDTETSNHLFYGEKPTKREKEEEGFKTRPIKDYSIDQLAEIIANSFLLDSRTSKCLNSGYSLLGCSCYMEKNTVHRNKIPMIKAVFVLGGKRITF